MNEIDAEKKAREHLASLIDLIPACAPLHIAYKEPSTADESYWFSVKFPDELIIGAGRIIGIKKTDGSLSYFGTDGNE